jgi:zinc transport system ATP-binding protein
VSLSAPVPQAAIAPAVEFRSADIGYDGRAVIHDLDLIIEPGEVVGVLGANGSGKSTMIRGLLGLTPILEGDIQLFGTPRAQFRDWARIGYVPQHQTVVGGIPSTVAEVVASGRLTSLRPWKRFGADDRAAVAAAIEAVGMGAEARASMAQLSGGQQRRVLIARALATAPDLLVLDEPTAGVDHANQEALAHALGALVAQGTTIVLITHELGPVEPLISRAIVLRNGTVVHDGPPDDHAFHHEHDDEWHHHHGDAPTRRPGLGLID